MMKPLYKQPLVEAVILASGILCTVVLIHGVQNFIALGGKPVTSQIAQKTNPDLVNVSAESFPLGDTCNRPGVCSANNYSSDDPPVINPGSVPEAYDLDKYTMNEPVSGTHKVSAEGFQQSEVDGAGADMYPKLCTMFGNTFPVNFTKAEKHRSNASDNNTPSADGANVFEFTLPAGTPITVPVSGRNILHGLDSAGDGPEGMIMYATADRFAFQIGRKDFLKNIWIYVMDVDVDRALVAAYDAANAAGRDKLPEVSTGQILATSRGKVRIGVRDVGKLLDLRHIYPWDPGFVSSLGITKRCTQDTSVAAAGVPPGGAAVPAGAVEDDVIKTSISTNSVQTKYPSLFTDFDKKKNVIVAGDSNTANITFILDRFTVEKKAQGEQGAKWLASQVPSFTANSKFALILIGVNEVHNGNNYPTKGSLSDFQANLSSIVDKTLEKGIIPVLQTIDDFDKTGDIPKNLKTVNKVIRDVASAKSVPLVVTGDYVGISFMKPDGDHSYHFNETTGAALRNQILRLVNDKLDGVAPAKPAGAAGPETRTVSGKIKLNGKGTYTIGIYQTDSETNYKRKDSDRVVINLSAVDQVEWSFVPKEAKTCIFARMWTQAEPVGEEKWVDSIIRCDLKPGDKDIELVIDVPAKDEANYTVSGSITLSNNQKLPPTRQFKLEVVNDKNMIVSTSIRRDVYSEILKKGIYTFKFTLYQTPISGQPDIDLLVTSIPITVGNSDIIKNINIPIEKLTTGGLKVITISASGVASACTPGSNGAYCVLKKVFPKDKSDVSLFIQGKGLSDEKYRAYENDARTQWNIDIFDIRIEKPFTSNDVIAAAVGDEGIIFHQGNEYSYVIK